MKRWHLTLGLAGTALAAAALAPRLKAMVMDLPTPPVQPPVVYELEPLPEPLEHGRLVISAGLDRTAVLARTPSERFLTITVKAPEEGGQAVRSPVNVAVVMDASGSMSAQGKIAYAKEAAETVVRSLQPTDAFSLVTFNDDAQVIVPASPGQSHQQLIRQIDRVYEGGGTNLYAGMHLAEREIARVLDSGEVGRLVILSDGNANVGVTDPDVLARFAAEAAGRGIAVSAMGLGVDYNEDLLAHIADVGGGTYDYIDNPAELAEVFSAELQRTSRVVARNTAVTIQLPADVQPIDVIGWDATPNEHGWTVFLGDIPAGAERKIVARVKVTASTEGTFIAGSAKAEYTDLIDDRPSVSSTRAPLTVTSDPNAVAASLDADRAAAANRAWGNHYLQMSTKAYAAGKRDEAQRLLQDGSSVLRSAAAETGSAVLAEDAETLERQRSVYTEHAPSSVRGLRAIKMNKEIVRDASR
ncbi:MAG: VWA domain-containing protein [Alphaproteobacteria bacterium]|nr:VWA domain-containing protein [Alphaproteobacteria bacterium]MCB9692742.1 VWA domain-containing protein [Alphaproteobacteria bacterium]